MKKAKTNALPPDIAALLDSTPETTQAMLDELADANRKIVSDPEFIADLERTKFVDSILSAIQETGTTRSQLAREVGVSRQYIQKVLDEDARVSFTLKTMVSLCHALGKELRLDIVDKAIANGVCIQSPKQKSRFGPLSSEVSFKTHSSNNPAKVKSIDKRALKAADRRAISTSEHENELTLSA